MATTIRLARHGAKKHPFYRIIVTDARAPRDGRRLDQIGTYDPTRNSSQVSIQEDKLELWLRRGARPSLTVAQLIKRGGLTSVAVATEAGTAEAVTAAGTDSDTATPEPAPDPGETQT